jgi:hypothetical protein
MHLDRIMPVAVLQLGLALMPMAAQGQVLLAEDFEGPARAGSLLENWSYFDPQANVGQLTGAAARRGTQGFRVIDLGGPSDNRQVGLGTRAYPPQGSAYARAFVRLDGLQGPGRTYLLGLDIVPGDNGQTQVSLAVDGPELRTVLLGKRLNMSRLEASGGVLQRQRWTLLEVLLTNTGSPNACARFAIDGVVAAESCGLDFGGMRFGQFSLGFTYQLGGTPSGTGDFDDAVFDDAPVASKLVLSSEVRAVRAQDCVAVRGELRGTFMPAPSPAPFDELVAVADPFDVFEDSACQLRLEGLPVRAGSTSVAAFVRARVNGVVALGAQPRSVLLESEPTFEVTGAASSAPAQALTTCGCSLTAWPAASVALLSALSRRRRPRQLEVLEARRHGGA